MVEVGDPMPDFSLPDPEGELHGPGRYRGRPVVVFFFPRALSPGCLREVRAFAELLPEFERLGAVVLGVGPDGPERMARFRERSGAGFPLLADPGAEVARRFGAFGEKRLYGRRSEGVFRHTYVADPEGRVVGRVLRARPEEHAERALSLVREAVGGG